ncbi:GNAT family N-acetyltransferase [Falsibacillus pallidus]|uniref:Acetyltransferase (GNAT) family protein n=1 Tax=Falsibacillus pallidus TaxID=493781 RepID=A0A370GVJ8_9BACI|nr:GNAT family N-acetyltransferase [Falsibacillus pallidus]RDI47687.1 acetyltransferase (GNAT) family protein [Falsibacillus pallidus]
MIEFIDNHWEQREIELGIMNSNPAYNLLVNGREVLSEDDIQKEYEESKKLKTERYLVKIDGKALGVIDFCPLNLNDQMPWLGLLVMHRSVQANGLGKEVYIEFEKQLKKRNFNVIRLGVIEGNKKACGFWKSIGFSPYDEKMLNGKAIYCFQKDINR